MWVLALSAVIGFTAGEARAGTLTEILTWGANSLTITTGSPFATVTTDVSGTHLTLNTDVLNAFLAANGSGLQFATGSGAYSNQNVATQASGAVLDNTGSVSVIPTGTGLTTMTINVTQTDWNVPNGPTGTLINTGSNSFTNTAAGDTSTANSWYNNNNAMDGKVLGAGLISFMSVGPAPNSPPGTPSDSTTRAISPFVIPFSLTNETVLNLTRTGLTGEIDSYAVHTKVSGAVPEPASIVLMLTSMPLPLVVVGLLRRRRRAVG